MSQQKSVCGLCGRETNNEDDFCPDCGTLFSENVKCTKHSDREANGVCVICCEPFCDECGFFVDDKIFLCTFHNNYEIYEGMARVYGSSDSVHVDYAKSCLKQAGLNPMVYSRKASPLHMGGFEYTLFEASGDYDGHIVNEIKLMIPVQQVIKAEEILRQLEILH